MNEIIRVAGAALLLDSVSGETGDVVLFLPGISGGAHSDRFSSLVDLCLSNHISIARMDAWENTEDVKEKTFAQLHGVLTEAIETLRGQGYKNIIAVGKSFGGGLFLSFHHPAIVKKILWAPAIGIANAGNFDELKSKKLKEIAVLLDITLSSTYVQEDAAEVNIIHGTADNVIPLQNSEAIMQVARGNLIVIDGADHSFKTEAEEQQLLGATATLLR